LSALYVLLLARLITATQQDDHRLFSDRVIDPVALAHIDSKLADALANAAVIAEVADTGEGIAPEDIRRIYDPFFSTRKKSGGNGLGLSISYGIVQEHGGAMEVESNVSTGTRFLIRFPAADSSADRPDSGDSSVAVPKAAGSRGADARSLS